MTVEGDEISGNGKNDSVAASNEPVGKQLLKRPAGGAPKARQTRAAKAALERLAPK